MFIAYASKEFDALFDLSTSFKFNCNALRVLRGQTSITLREFRHNG